jgi:DNA polymerase-3 subunit epsilon
MAAGLSRAVAAALTVSGAALAGLATLALWPSDGDPSSGRVAAAGALALGGLGALWIAGTLVARHAEELGRLRDGLIAARRRSIRIPDLDGDAGRLADAVRSSLRSLSAEATRTDDRLAAVLSALDGGVIVVTDSGLVSLVNAAAAALLGPQRVAVGTSVYAALEPSDLSGAIRAARRSGRPVPADLPTVDGASLHARVADLDGLGGAVILFPASASARSQGLEHDLELHDRPPPPPPLADDLALEEVPVLALDIETTGLDVERDRLLSVGAVRLHGTRLFRAVALDRLVDPGVPVPPAASAVHGITDAMVEGAPSFAEVWPELEAMMSGVVVVGHNIGFDLAVLRREVETAGGCWSDPPSLDTMRLVAALDPSRTDLNLETVMADFGIGVEGRHTAFGDALAAAELYAHLVPLLRDRGVTGLSQARAFADSARRVRTAQRAAGW